VLKRERETTAIKACFYFQSIPLLLENKKAIKLLNLKKREHFTVQETFIQQYNDPTMLFKQTEIIVPSIAIKSTTFLCHKGTDRQCPIFQTWLLSLTAVIFINLQTLESSTLHSYFHSCLSVWLHRFQ